MRPIEAKLAAIGGTRQMIAENCFDALINTLVETKVISATKIAIMLDRLAVNLGDVLSSPDDCPWVIDRSEMMDQVRRLKEISAYYGDERNAD